MYGTPSQSAPAWTRPNPCTACHSAAGRAQRRVSTLHTACLHTTGAMLGPAQDVKPKYNVKHITNISQVYVPSNPKWLVEAVQWAPDNIPQQFLPEPPPLQQFKASLTPDGRLPVEFGSDACRALFSLNFEEITYLNHGSYGACSKLALEVQSWYRQQLEAEPVAFMESTAVAGQVAALAQVAEYLGASWRDVVPVVNATTAVNAVVNSIPLQPGDLLLMSNTTYPAVRSTLAAAASRSGSSLLDLSVEEDEGTAGVSVTCTDPEALVGAYREVLATHGQHIKLVVVDHVISFPPLVMPVQQICALCRAAGVPVLVDGAHAVGALPGLQVAALGADYYTTNLHKWLCSPKGCAVLWVSPQRQAQVRPLVVSHGYQLGFRGEFLWQGTSDVTPWLAAPASLTLITALGPAAVAAYNHGLVKQAVGLLTSAWGPGLRVLGVAKDGSTAGMAAVQLPAELRVPASRLLAGSEAVAAVAGNAGTAAAATESMSASKQQNAIPTSATGGTAVAAGDGPVLLPPQAAAAATDTPPGDATGGAAVGPPADELQPLPVTPGGAAALNLLLRQQHHIEVPVACVRGLLWVRISAQVYNRLADYERLAAAINSMRAAS